jgi:general secretion pathway protein D
VSYLQRKPSTSGNFAGIGAINNVPFLRESIFAQTGTNVSVLPSGLSYFARLGGDLDVTAQAIATDNRINILSRPRIQTSHAVEANLFVGETRPYITGTYSYFGGGGPSSQYSQLQIGITLSVLPLINVDGLVVMDIRQRIQSLGGFQKIDNNDIPITIDREANAKIAVKDRETIVLGGFISNEKRKGASGVPLLKDIPILGNFFRSTAKESHRKELMILMRPTVLPTPTDASAIALEEKSRMHGVTEMEQSALKEDRNNQRKAEKALLKRENLE